MFVTILIIAVVVGVLVGVANKKEQNRLREEYSKALRGGDKRRALEAGRAYYASLRKGGKLTMYDEQAITNDLSIMKEQ